MSPVRILSSLGAVASKAKRCGRWAWEGWCVCSLVGIWPRWIEPNLLFFSRINVVVPQLSRSFDGLKILHVSDLHWSADFSRLLKKQLLHQIASLEVDLVVFTGDFISKAKLEDKENLQSLLNAFKARFGCFAVLGNHDYAQFVTVGKSGDYEVDASSSSVLASGFNRLLRKIKPTGRVANSAKEVDYHQELVDLLKQTPFELLNNTTRQVSVQGEWINICGLEEHCLGRSNPLRAFQNYNPQFPGIILSHNPDAIERLSEYPGDLILSGHTHGGQVNLPFLWDRFTLVERTDLKRGLKKVGKKWIYISRGIGSIMKFRWFSPPQISLLTLRTRVLG